jgi:hypothetical protein
MTSFSGGPATLIKSFCSLKPAAHVGRRGPRGQAATCAAFIASSGKLAVLRCRVRCYSVIFIHSRKVSPAAKTNGGGADGGTMWDFQVCCLSSGLAVLLLCIVLSFHLRLFAVALLVRCVSVGRSDAAHDQKLCAQIAAESSYTTKTDILSKFFKSYSYGVCALYVSGAQRCSQRRHILDLQDAALPRGQGLSI